MVIPGYSRIIVYGANNITNMFNDRKETPYKNKQKRPKDDGVFTKILNNEIKKQKNL